MSTVSYRGQKLIPAPPVSVRQNKLRREDGLIIGAPYSLVIRGRMLADRGSPNSSGIFWDQSGYPPNEVVEHDSRLGAILRKQAAIRGLFSVDGGSLEFQSADGSEPFRCNPRVLDVNIPEGQWVDVFDYEISLEAEVVHGIHEPQTSGSVSRVSREWNLEDSENGFGRAFRLTHSISAAGKRVYDEAGNLQAEAWQAAQDYVLNQVGLGISNVMAQGSGVLDLNMQAFDYTRSVNTNEGAGSYSVQESWLLFDPEGGAPAKEDYTVTARTDASGRTSVSVDGTITGFEKRDTTTRELISTRFANAATKYTAVSAELFSRCESLSGVDLHPTSVSSQVGRNEVAGVITYQSEYDDRPDHIWAGSRSETVSASVSYPTATYASVPILGRTSGPLLQSLGAYTSGKKTLSIDVQMSVPTRSHTPSAPSTDAMVLSQTPAGTSVWLDQDEINWSTSTGRYTRNTVWTWQP